MTNLKSQKQHYREQARIHRDRLLVTMADSEAVVDVFFQTFKIPQNSIIAAYWPVGKELDVRPLLDECHKRGYICALPVVQSETREMKFVVWTPQTTLVKGCFGVMEPQAGEEVLPDVVIAPLLAYDQKGYRLGQGGGHYDATVESMRQKNKIMYIGAGYPEQAVLFKLPQEDHDIPLDYMLSPRGVVKF